MQITISGDIGSGKSSVGEYLANELSIPFVDCGQIYRNYAKQKGIDVLQQNRSDDYSIDEQIDNDLKWWGTKNKAGVYVSRTAWYFMPFALHIYLCIDPMTAAERILVRRSNAEEHSSLEDIIKYNEERIKREDTRYERMYGITRKSQLNNTQIIMHIGDRTFNEVCACLLEIVHKFNDTHNMMLAFDPRAAIPTYPLSDLDKISIENSKAETGPIIKYDAIRMQFANNKPYIIDGHCSVASACLTNVKFMCTTDFEISDKSFIRLSNKDYSEWQDYTTADLNSVMTEPS